MNKPILNSVINIQIPASSLIQYSEENSEDTASGESKQGRLILILFQGMAGTIRDAYNIGFTGAATQSTDEDEVIGKEVGTVIFIWNCALCYRFHLV